MRKFIANLLSNRFGIVLAAVNLCYFASQANNVKTHLLDMAFCCANSPAIILALAADELMRIFMWQSSFQTRKFLTIGLALAFVVLQWLCIAWFAKTIAARIRRPKMQ